MGDRDIELLVETGHTVFLDFYSVVTDFSTRTEKSPRWIFTVRFLKVYTSDSSFSQSYHFDLPFALQEDDDGWENKATVSAYEDYARFASRLMEI